MMTGILKPTQGEIEVYGNSIYTDLAKVQTSLGFCQQFDVLIELLTV